MNLHNHAMGDLVFRAYGLTSVLLCLNLLRSCGRDTYLCRTYLRNICCLAISAFRFLSCCEAARAYRVVRNITARDNRFVGE